MFEHIEYSYSYDILGQSVIDTFNYNIFLVEYMQQLNQLLMFYSISVEPIGAESIIKPPIVTEEIKAQNLHKLPIMAHTTIDLPVPCLRLLHQCRNTNI